MGLVLFLCGVNVGFAPVGTLLGHELAAGNERFLLVPIGMLIGYFIVKAEPAIQILNHQVQQVTDGAISAKAMNRCLSIGVSVSVGLSLLRSLTGIPLLYILLLGYLAALALSLVVPKIFVGIAFDSGGVASGPITTTFLLPLCIGVCDTMGGNIMTDAFGVVSLVALTPLIAIQLMGLVYRMKLAGVEEEYTEIVIPGDDDIILLEEEKQQLLRELGIQRYVLFPFHEKTASMEPEAFVEEVLVKTMDVKKIYVGTDYRFGKGRKGDVALLEQLSKQYGYAFEAVEKKLYDGAEISSSRIRDCITKGKMYDVQEMLGMTYRILGNIIHGKKLGHKIGVPTINQIVPEGKILPRLGVYCSKVTVDGREYYGITNVGSKPTVQEELIYGAETHLFDCRENMYGQYAKTELLQFVRPERKFASVEELTMQLEQDIQLGRTYFKELLP